MERGTVSMRVALVLRSAEVQPLFRDLCNVCICSGVFLFWKSNFHFDQVFWHCQSSPPQFNQQQKSLWLYNLNIHHPPLNICTKWKRKCKYLLSLCVNMCNDTMKLIRDQKGCRFVWSILLYMVLTKNCLLLFCLCYFISLMFSWDWYFTCMLVHPGYFSL